VTITRGEGIDDRRREPWAEACPGHTEHPLWRRIAASPPLPPQSNFLLPILPVVCYGGDDLMLKIIDGDQSVV
jgi:hypothetical protein